MKSTLGGERRPGAPARGGRAEYEIEEGRREWKGRPARMEEASTGSMRPPQDAWTPIQGDARWRVGGELAGVRVVASVRSCACPNVGLRFQAGTSDRIVRRMDELLLRYLRGQTTEDENRTVEARRRESPDGDKALDDLRRVADAGRLADQALDPGDPPSARQVIWRAEARAAGSAGRGTHRARRPRPAPSRFGLFAGWATAAAAAMAGLAFWLTSSRPERGGGNGALAVQEFITAPGETAMVRLGDGSVIRLGPASRLTMPAGESARTVTLEGEGFFSIAHDETRSFRVSTAAGTARVLGTRFHLAAQADELRLVVVEGRVALGSTDHEVQVGGGQMTSLREGRAEPVQEALPVEEVADWMSDFLIFQDTPLGLAMQEVGRRYGTDVEVSDPALLDRTLTMWFSSKSLEEVMIVVCGVIDARCSIGDDVVRIQSRDTGADR